MTTLESSLSVGVKEINEAYFDSCNFESLLLGIQFAIFIMAFSKIYRAQHRTTRSRAIMIILITFFLALSTSHHAAFWRYVRHAFITRGATANSTADSLNEYPNWYIGMISIPYANAILADCVIIWRCWVVWGKTWNVIIMPVICTILTAVFCVTAILNKISHSTNFGSVGVDYATALYSTSLATTLYCTALVVYRVLQVGYRSHPGSGGFRHYGVIEIFVESSALYCVATLFVLISHIHSGPVSEFAFVLWISVTGVAPTLIFARVAAGNAQSSQTCDASGPSPSVLHLRNTTHESVNESSRHRRGKSSPDDLDRFTLSRNEEHSEENPVGEKNV